ncbi:MAG: protoporphyrinogen oxidase [Opitutaceae bacterium]|nr:protoporphyrinogen oxidase [Opitutaceae bacterium]
MRPKTIAILGAGITGLTAAYRLCKQGHRVRVFEQSSRVGGAIGSESVDGWLIEHGPNSLLENESALSALLEELGLREQVCPANPSAKKRFIVRRGRPLAAPMSPPALLRTPLFSFGAKCRLLTELFQRPRQRAHDVSLAAFITDHFGREIVDYGINPFVGGVYAGDPEKLSAQHAFPTLWASERQHGSLIRGMMAAAKARKAVGQKRGGIISFQRGLQTLPDALAAALPAGALQLQATVTALIPGQPWTVRYPAGTETHEETFDAVASALPAGTLAELTLGHAATRPLAALGQIEFPPVASLCLGYHRSQIAHPLDGFGVLVPAIEQRSILGVLFSSTLFPGRAPQDHVALTVMVGGCRQPELATLPAETLLAHVQADLAQLLGVQGPPSFQRHRLWPRAIPQYNLGHERFLAAMTTCERDYPGFFIGGQCRDGIAVPACIAAGEKLAARASA